MTPDELRTKVASVTGERGHAALDMALMAAVPLRILEMVRQGGPAPEDWDTLGDRLGPILQQADSVLLYKGRDRKEGEVAAAFSELARGLAILSFLPGGVPFGSQIYDHSAYAWADQMINANSEEENDA